MLQGGKRLENIPAKDRSVTNGCCSKGEGSSIFQQAITGKNRGERRGGFSIKQKLRSRRQLVLNHWTFSDEHAASARKNKTGRSGEGSRKKVEGFFPGKTNLLFACPNEGGGGK